MLAIEGMEEKTIRIGDDLVQATTGKVEHTLYKTVGGIEYKIEICAAMDIYTAQKIVRKLK